MVTGPSERQLRAAEGVGLLALCASALAAWVRFPVLPTYDSLFSLVWGQQLLAGHAPGFADFRAPTEHPLWLLVSVISAAFGSSGARVMTAIGVGSFVLLVVGVYLLARLMAGRVAAAVAAALMMTRLDFGFWAAFAFLDIPFAACVVWAALLEARQARRGGWVWALLIGAGTLRPEGWLLAGVYGIWMVWGRPLRTWWPTALAVAAAPVAWVLVDLAVTGKPLFSFTYTTGEAAKLGRQRTLLDLPDVWLGGMTEVLKAPVLLLGLIGMVYLFVDVRRAAGSLTARDHARRMAVALFVLGAVTFSVVVLGGVSGQVPRYTVICAVGVVLAAGYLFSRLARMPTAGVARAAWIAGAAALVLAGVWSVARVHPRSITSELRFRVQIERDLARAVGARATREGLRCGPLAVANHRLVPAARWYLGHGTAVRARNDRALLRRDPTGPTLLMLGSRALSNGGYGSFGARMFEPALLTQVPPAGSEWRGRTTYFAIYVRCPR